MDTLGTLIHAYEEDQYPQTDVNGINILQYLMEEHHKMMGKMITKEVIKSEIDKVQDSYLEVLYRIIEALINPPDWATATPQGTTRTSDWHKFVDDTYGCLADDPIERGDQGQYEIRETIK